MVTEVKVIADSGSEVGHRISTMQLRFPKFILAEFNTHRVFSRNASSSRAIPVQKLIAQVNSDPVIPKQFGKNQPGMQAAENLYGTESYLVKGVWKQAAEAAVYYAAKMANAGVHKQLVNRILEPFTYVSVVVTSTEWENFFGLRCHPDAQPEMQELAYAMRDALNVSMVQMLYPGEWHLPYVTTEERVAYPLKLLRKISAARCCRVSYLRHDGTPAPIDEDLALCERLLKSVPFHASPFEHQATPDTEHPELHGNFTGWIQYRKMLERKNDSVAVPH